MSPPLQEPEVQLAQRLASNEKPIRSKAIKKLRKYISVRSQKGGFTGDELLKLWKGLFYCLWMQDKLLLQEELSNQISLLLHSFHHVDSQFLYLESFLQTMKREWTGIDGLRMDKFFQLVRFMFRQTFEMLKRKNWETSVVGRFLELLTAQVLQGGSAAPSGLQFHILDIYMTELAATGSAELTADQNLVFIEPFCRTAAKTKDRILFNAICGSILSTIIDQAPFAIEDLMKEMKAAQASDSGQASEEEEEEEKKSKPASKKATGKQMNGSSLGTKSDDDEEDDEDDELLHLEDSDSELPDDGGIGPVLQFDYSALANKLLELASRSNTPSQNRQRLYKIIKLLRDLSEGVFPQNEYPEEVSTDEDDDEMFGSRKRMKRRKRFGEEEEGGPAAKKRKGKKKDASKLSQQNKDSTNDDNEPAESVTKKKKKRKKKKKKKDAGQGKGVGGEEKANGPEQVIDVGSLTDADTQKSAIKDTETAAGAQEGSPPIEAEKEAKMETSVRVTEAVTPTDTEGQSEIRVLLEVKNQSVRVTDEASEPEPRATEDTNEDQSETLSKKKKRKKSEVNSEIPKPTVEVTEAAGEQPAPVTQDVEAAVAAVEPETSPEATTPGKKKSKKKSLEAEKKADEVEAEAEGGNTVAEITSITGKASEDTTTPLKKKAKKGKQEVKMAQGAEATDPTPEDVSLEAAIAEESANDTPLKKKKKKKSQKTSETEELEVVEETTAVAETPQEVDAEEPSSEITLSTPAKKKKKKQKAAQVSEVKGEIQSEVAGDADEEPPACEAPPESEALPSSVKKGKKKRKIPVVFEFEADEAATNGVEEDDAKKAKLGNEVEETPTPLGSKKSKKKKAGTESDFITFQSNASIPRPLFYKTKGSPSTPLSGKKKRQTPTSDSKKVTFGLKNNKTAEFRKTDRSLLVSPEGSSRVPFDPEQKPKFGVLKSPVIKKTLKANKTPKNTPKRRPVAADFF